MLMIEMGGKGEENRSSGETKGVFKHAVCIVGSCRGRSVSQVQTKPKRQEQCRRVPPMRRVVAQCGRARRWEKIEERRAPSSISSQ